MQQDVQTNFPDPSFEEFEESFNPFRQVLDRVSEAVVLNKKLKNIPHSRIDAHEGSDPTTPSTQQLGVGGSQSEWESLNNHVLTLSLSSVHRRPGGGAPNRYDVSVSPMTLVVSRSNLDMSFGSMDLTPSITSELTSIASEVTPDDNELEEEEGRGNKSCCSNTSDNSRQLRSRRRSISSDSERFAMCGTVGINNEIRESMRDVTYSVQQILKSVGRFGPDERDAVKETLLEAKHFLRQKCKAALSPEEVCGPLDITPSFDDVGDDTRLSVRDSKMSYNFKRRSIVSSDLNSPDDADNSRITSNEVRRPQRAKDRELSDLYDYDISDSDLSEGIGDMSEGVVYSMPIDRIGRSRMPGRSRRF